MGQDNKKPKKKFTPIDSLLDLIFGEYDPTSNPVIRGIGPAPKLLRPGQSLPIEKKDTEIH